LDLLESFNTIRIVIRPIKKIYIEKMY